MKKKLRKYIRKCRYRMFIGRIVSIFLALVFMMSGLLFSMSENNAYAAGGTITSVEKTQDDYGREPKFTIVDSLGTHTALCINFNAKIPEAGSVVSEPVLSNNDALRRVLYYGNGGPADLGVYGWTFTAMAASSAMGNIPMKDGVSVGDHYTLSLFASQPVPPSTFKVYIVSTGNSAYQPMAYWINEPQGAAYIQKSSANTSITTGNNCYSLKNAIYGIYRDSSCTSKVTQLATDENGKTPTTPLDPGTYYVKEITAPKGYILDKTVYPCVVVSGKTTSIAVKDVPGNDPVSIILTKIDKDTGETVQGAGDLSGAEFTICYYDGYYNTSNLPSTPTRKWVIKTSYDSSTGKYATRLDKNNLISGDDFYYNNQNPCLPLGTITIEETKAPVGYTLEGAIFTTASGTPVTGKYLTQITSTTSGNGASLVGGNVFTVSDSVVRADLEIHKTDFETGEAMANVRFRLTSKTTGESHEFVTDENGYYSTAASYIPHTTNTNGGNAGDGIYFGGDGADDSLGALPYDKYLLEEIPCEANEGKSMYSGTIDVNSTTTITKSIANKDLALKTTATFADGTHYGAVGEDVVVTDIATYEGLTVGEEYTVKGTLMDKATGEAPILADGSTVTAEKTFTPSAANGTVEIEFAFNTAGLNGKTVVVFEDLYIDDLKVMSHADINDVDQTIYFPEIGTTLADTVTEGHNALVAEDITLVDTVAYTGLEPGAEHTVTGVLMDKETGEPALDDKGNEITAETSFIPETSSGTVEVTFTFSGINLAGTSVVAFETFYKNNREYAVHADINDERQTVDFPKIHTSVRDAETGIQNSYADEEITIIDTVTYANVEPGVEHILKGTLMDQTTGEPVTDSEGNAITAETIFTPEERNGEAEVTFVFDGTGMENKTFVVFEDLYLEDYKVAVHADIEDEGQTIWIPGIETTATDNITGGHLANAAENVTITDKVEYTNLIPGKEYTVSGILYVQETGEVLLVNGNEVTAEKTFVAEEADGYVELDFTFDASALAGKTTVAFETVKYDDITVAVHADIDDEDQSVFFPKVSTTATSGGKHEVTAKESVTLVDTVKYENLIPGEEYTLKGTVMDKETGKVLVIDGKAVTAEKTFTAENADGTVDVSFTFNASALAGKSVVVFEKLYIAEGDLIASHEDIEDKGQTVKFVEPPKTGDTTRWVLWFAAAFISGGIAVITIVHSRKRRNI